MSDDNNSGCGPFVIGMIILFAVLGYIAQVIEENKDLFEAIGVGIVLVVGVSIFIKIFGSGKDKD